MDDKQLLDDETLEKIAGGVILTERPLDVPGATIYVRCVSIDEHDEQIVSSWVRLEDFKLNAPVSTGTYQLQYLVVSELGRQL